MLTNWWGGSLLAALALVACGSEQVAEPTEYPDAGFIVSAPIPRASLPESTDSSGTVVFVSATPHAVPGAVQATVLGEDGQSTTAEVYDGGFDPVTVSATDGDVITVTLTDAGGATRSEELTVHARRPPRVVRTSPTPNQTDVPLNAVIRVVFSSPVDLQSARDGIRLTTGSGTVVPGVVEAAGRVAVDYVLIDGNLAPETTYRLDVTTVVRDLLGQALAQAVRVEFRTGTTEDDRPRDRQPALDLVIAPGRLDLMPGDSGQVQVTIARGESFSSAVTLSARGHSGVRVTFSNGVIDAGSTTATIKVEVDAWARAGTRSIVVRAVGDGPSVVTSTRTLVVTVPVTPPGSLEVVIAPTSIDVVPGGKTGEALVTITRGGSFAGAVTLGSAGPEGVFAGSATFPAGSTTASITVGASAVAVPGTRTVSFHAYNSEGPPAVSARAALTVNVLAPAGSVSLVPDPNLLAVAAGGPAVTSTVAISRTPPFAGPVELTLTGVPNGVTATLSNSIETGASPTLTVSAAPGALNGAYAIRIDAKGADIADASTTVWLAITGGEPGFFTFDPATLTVTAGGASATALLTRASAFLGGRLVLLMNTPPAGITTSFSNRPQYMALTSAPLTVQADATVAAGTYFLIVRSYIMRVEPDLGGSRPGNAVLRVVVLAAPT